MENKLNACKKHGLSLNEYDLLYGIFKCNSGSIDALADIIEILKADNIKPTDLLKSLQAKGVIKNTYKIPSEGEEFDAFTVHLNKAITNTFMRSADALFNELYSLYPSFGTTSNGQWFPLRNLTKYYMDDRAAGLAYMKKIRGEYELHKEIIELVKWAKDETVGALKWTLTEFIGSGKWDELKEMKNRPELLNNFSDNLVDLN